MPNRAVTGMKREKEEVRGKKKKRKTKREEQDKQDLTGKREKEGEFLTVKFKPDRIWQARKREERQKRDKDRKQGAKGSKSENRA